MQMAAPQQRSVAILEHTRFFVQTEQWQLRLSNVV